MATRTSLSNPRMILGLRMELLRQRVLHQDYRHPRSALRSHLRYHSSLPHDRMLEMARHQLNRLRGAHPLKHLLLSLNKPFAHLSCPNRASSVPRLSNHKNRQNRQMVFLKSFNHHKGFLRSKHLHSLPRRPTSRKGYNGRMEYPDRNHLLRRRHLLLPTP